MAEQTSKPARRKAGDGNGDGARDVQPVVDQRREAKADAVDTAARRYADDPDYGREVGQRPDLPVVEIGDAVRAGGDGPGYIGQVPDTTDNDAYTLRGVGESDAAALADRRAARRMNIG